MTNEPLPFPPEKRFTPKKLLSYAVIALASTLLLTVVFTVLELSKSICYLLQIAGSLLSAFLFVTAIREARIEARKVKEAAEVNGE